MTAVSAASAQPATTSGRAGLFFGLDAVVTGVNAVGYLALASVLDDFLGGDPAVLRLVGAALLAFTVLVGRVATTGARQRAVAETVVAINVAWTVASLVVAAADPLDLTAVGRGWVVAQALVVGAFAVLQQRALTHRST